MTVKKEEPNFPITLKYYWKKKKPDCPITLKYYW
jgi:hypothetical protein